MLGLFVCLIVGRDHASCDEANDHSSPAEVSPYASPPPATPPVYRVRYEAKQVGGLAFPVQYTVWVPPGVSELRGVVVHQHGCGEGSCLSGQTGAFDWHWQALAAAHDCALLSPSYEQPQDAACQLWCDPRNGSSDAFLQSLEDLGEASGHPELSQVPWALWGHSGGGHWSGGMLMLHPDRVAAAWLRSGVPLLEANPERDDITPYEIDPRAASVPVMCNLGTLEGFSETEGRFAGVWPAVDNFVREMRKLDAPIGIAIDPVTSHECGDQRYLAIPFLDECLRTRLPEQTGDPLRSLTRDAAWLASFPDAKEQPKPEAVPADQYSGDHATAIYLPNEALATRWQSYIENAEVPDETEPPAPNNVRLDGRTLRWDPAADLQSGISHFVILSGGKQIGRVPQESKNRFGRRLFQGLLYSDTPHPLWMEPRFQIPPGYERATFRVVAVNTVGTPSRPSQPTPVVE